MRVPVVFPPKVWGVRAWKARLPGCGNVSLGRRGLQPRLSRWARLQSAPTGAMFTPRAYRGHAAPRLPGCGKTHPWVGAVCNRASCGVRAWKARLPDSSVRAYKARLPGPCLHRAYRGHACKARLPGPCLHRAPSGVMLALRVYRGVGKRIIG